MVCIKHPCKSERCGKRDFLPGSKAFVFALQICVQTPGLELLVAGIFCAEALLSTSLEGSSSPK